METEKIKKPEEEGVRPFDATLRSLDEGSVHNELSKEMHKLVGELYELALNGVGAGKPVRGAITLVLDIGVSANGAAVLKGDVKVKSPKLVRTPSVMFITKGGNLSTENQRQQKLALKEVPTANREARDVAGEDRPARSV